MASHFSDHKLFLVSHASCLLPSSLWSTFSGSVSCFKNARSTIYDQLFSGPSSVFVQSSWRHWVEFKSPYNSELYLTRTYSHYGMLMLGLPLCPVDSSPLAHSLVVDWIWFSSALSVHWRSAHQFLISSLQLASAMLDKLFNFRREIFSIYPSQFVWWLPILLLQRACYGQLSILVWWTAVLKVFRLPVLRCWS